jgi:hypothetical protein
MYKSQHRKASIMKKQTTKQYKSSPPKGNNSIIKDLNDTELDEISINSKE